MHDKSLSLRVEVLNEDSEKPKIPSVELAVNSNKPVRFTGDGLIDRPIPISQVNIIGSSRGKGFRRRGGGLKRRSALMSGYEILFALGKRSVLVDIWFGFSC